MKTAETDVNQIRIYSLICSSDGIKASQIARKLGLDKALVNRLLYNSPFIHELCYCDKDYYWHGLIRQTRPHTGLSDFCGYYGSVERFRSESAEEWLEELKEGCRSIGRNLNDTRGLIHSFLDSREVMLGLFEDLDTLESSAGRKVDPSGWEIAFELRIKRARHVRIYADVLVITAGRVFSLEFKMKDVIDPGEELQAVKYARYMDVIFGPSYEVIPALVLTKAQDLYSWQELPGSTAELPVCSGDMLFNLFDEYMGFLG